MAAMTMADRVPGEDALTMHLGARVDMAAKHIDRTILASTGPSGERAKGAVRGAAAGAVIGEVANNDAGEGAATGAAVGVVAGGHRTRQARRTEQANAQEQAKADASATQQAQADTFKRGISGCLESRGYTIK